MTSMPSEHNFNVLSLIQSNHISLIEQAYDKYFTIPTHPAKGVLYVTQNNPEFISGHVRMRGRNNGSYPYNYLEMTTYAAKTKWGLHPSQQFDSYRNLLWTLNQRYWIRRL